MILMTERLELVPLNARRLKLWIDDLPTLEKELNCSYRAEPLEGSFLDIVKKQLTITQNDPDNCLWHSFWLLIRQTDRVVVGSADFKNVPNDRKEVEIGYGLGKTFEHKGYMTEAVIAMCDWALQQSAVESIIAETYPDGLASQRVLQRCGFREERKAETLWWRLDASSLQEG